MNQDLTTEYAKRFGELRTDASRSRWSALTYHRAPHKPLLLLCVLDLFEQGDIQSNLLELTPELGELFTRYWANVMPPDRHSNIALPFFHLRSDGFWRLIPNAGKENVLESATQIRSLFQLRDAVAGARLEEDLYKLLQAFESRTMLRAVLVRTYFAPELWSTLFEQSAVNHEAFRYSKELLQRNDEKVAEALAEEQTYRPAARDQGFRRAVVIAYVHRCAFCGVRVLTLDGHTAVEASHIVPWSLSYNDHPTNGIAFCRMCHWAFDEGLMRISTGYKIVASSQLSASDNLPGYLSNLEGRNILGPAQKPFWPDTESLRWHHKNVFRAW
ncbi:HNH endonuclease [soil metagenome]